MATLALVGARPSFAATLHARKRVAGPGSGRPCVPARARRFQCRSVELRVTPRRKEQAPGVARADLAGECAPGRGQRRHPALIPEDDASIPVLAAVQRGGIGGRGAGAAGAAQAAEAESAWAWDFATSRAKRATSRGGARVRRPRGEGRDKEEATTSSPVSFWMLRGSPRAPLAEHQSVPGVRSRVISAERRARWRRWHAPTRAVVFTTMRPSSAVLTLARAPARLRRRARS